MRDYNSLHSAWLKHEGMPKSLVKELKAMSEKQKTDAFYQDVEFGTAGMRGLLGAGTNRLNSFTIRRAALGFGHYLLKVYGEKAKKQGVVIAHDNRHFAKEFMNESSLALRSLGIKTFVFDELKPTPLLSFATRHLGCVGGIMITASHNPKTYNGFKVYDDTGAQLTPEKVDLLLEELNKLPDFLDIKLEEPENSYALLSDNTEEEYFARVLKIQLRRRQNKKGFKVVFSPQHGTGRKLGLRALNVIGYEVIAVQSQMDPDPNFSNTKSPNPEEKVAYEEAIKMAFAYGAQLIITTDPDADRLGIAYKNKDGKYDYLTGNQSGALLIDYILKTRQERGELLKDGHLYTTIVTSSLGNKVAESYGVKVKEFLTGFKFIGAQIALDDKEGVKRFEFGYEESYGLLVAPFVRDKDAIQALVMYTEMALYYYNLGKTLDVAFDELQQKHGYHLDVTTSINFPGAEGQQAMQNMLTKLRNNPLKEIAGHKVVQIDDYLKSETKVGDQITQLTLPKADVLRFHLMDGSTISVRPSGTEPKCKVYFGVISKEKEAGELLLEELKKGMDLILN